MFSVLLLDFGEKKLSIVNSHIHLWIYGLLYLTSVFILEQVWSHISGYIMCTNQTVYYFTGAQEKSPVVGLVVFVWCD